MHPFKIQGCLIFLCISVIFLTLDPGRSEASLLSGWILPDPSQVVMVGLFFLHVIGLQLAVAGGYLMPPHNPFFGRRKRGLSSNSRRISRQEFKSIEAMLWTLRRIDDKNCFLRAVCQMSQNVLITRNQEQFKLLQVFRLRKQLGIKSGSREVWEVYEDAREPAVTSCSKKYPTCPLTKKELELDMRLGLKSW